MKRRYSIYLGLIAILVAIIIGRWWIHAVKAGGASATHGKIFLPEDFRLRVESSDTLVAQRRNLFQPAGKVAMRIPLLRHGRATVNTVVQPQLKQAEAADAEFGKLKLLGVVFHAGRAQAYLALDKENVIALAGDTIFGRFSVDEVGVDAVNLRDLKTNLSRRIPVSGK